MLPSHTYHIYNHANGADDLFRSPENYEYFRRKWCEYIDPIGETLVYCLMPNHFHVMVEVKVVELLIDELDRKRKLDWEVVRNLRGLSEMESISDLKKVLGDETISSTKNLEGFYQILTGYLIQQFSNFFNGYTKAINKRYRRYGSLFAPRFRRIPVTSGEYAKRLIRYIHANPVHHGFCKQMHEWSFSSWDYYQDKTMQWKELTISKYFEEYAGFIRWHNEAPIIDEQLDVN